MNNPFKEEGDNVNAFDLVNAIDFLYETKQWNQLMKFMAGSKPKDFISHVNLFRESDESLKLVPPNEVDFWIMHSGPNKINEIKIIREMGNLGLADSKAICESSPCKLFESTYDSDAVQCACKYFHDIGTQIMLKPKDDKIQSKFRIYGGDGHVLRTVMGWIKDPKFVCPTINTLY